jgi:hypothetical protein
MSYAYTANSLADIAEDFDRRAEVTARSAVNARKKSEEGALRAAALAWATAADILRNTTLTGAA